MGYTTGILLVLLCLWEGDSWGGARGWGKANKNTDRVLLMNSGTLRVPAMVQKPIPVPPTQSCPPGAKVFIGNLPFEVTDRDVAKLLEMVRIGESKYTKINIAMGKKTKRPLGWLLIDFKDAETARMCVAAVDGIDFLGRTVNANIKDPPVVVRKPIREHMVYLNNLDYTLTEIEIYNMCEDLVGPGLVMGVKIPLDKLRGRARGYAHVEFTDTKTMQLACTQLTGVEVLERVLKAEPLSAPRRREKREEGASAGDDDDDEDDDDENYEDERGRL